MKTKADSQNQAEQTAAPQVEAKSARQPARYSGLSLPSRIGNRAVQRLFQPNPKTVIPNQPLRLQAKLTVNTPGDSYEQEADRISEQVMRTSGPQVQRKCACEGSGCSKCGNEKIDQVVQTKRIQGSVSGEMLAPPIVQEALSSPGQPLDSSTREFMESRFGQDFSQVRVHTDAEAAESAQAVRALAYTVGPNVIFGPGQYSPGTSSGRQLLAHELTHVLQQGGGGIEGSRANSRGATAQSPQPHQVVGVNSSKAGGLAIRSLGHAKQVQRKPDKESSPDPLCKDFEYSKKKFLIYAKLLMLKATGDTERRQNLIRELKWIWRCATDAQKNEIKAQLENQLGAKPGAAVWKEAGTPFGGYRGAYPGYYSGKGLLTDLGITEVNKFDSFDYNPRESESVRTVKFRSGKEATATAEAASMVATDILYFYGHQYAQYQHPGVFANWTETQFIDLRALAGKGDFSRVKLIISTSCATCCTEAVDTFHGLFPNAVILGFRRTSPGKKGEPMRAAFNSGVKGLKKPLLLDQPVDINTIIGVWQAAAKSLFPKENKSQPAYYRNGKVHYQEMGKWHEIAAADPENSCVKKGSRIEEAGHR